MIAGHVQLIGGTEKLDILVYTECVSRRQTQLFKVETNRERDPACLTLPLCINKGGWSIRRRPKSPERHHSPHLSIFAPGIRQTPTTVPEPFSPYTAPFPVRSSSPPQLFLCIPRPTGMRLVCLMPAL